MRCSMAIHRSGPRPHRSPRAGRPPCVRPRPRPSAGLSGRGGRACRTVTLCRVPRAENSVRLSAAISSPRPMTINWSAVCSISDMRWLETNTVRPSAASRLNRSRTHFTPSGSRPLSGSSKSSTGGSPSRAEAIPSRCFMPSENPPMRRWATLGETDLLAAPPPPGCCGIRLLRARADNAPSHCARRAHRARREGSRHGAGRGGGRETTAADGDGCRWWARAGRGSAATWCSCPHRSVRGTRSLHRVAR